MEGERKAAIQKKNDCVNKRVDENVVIKREIVARNGAAVDKKMENKVVTNWTDLRHEMQISMEV